MLAGTAQSAVTDHSAAPILSVPNQRIVNPILQLTDAVSFSHQALPWTPTN